MSKAGVSRIDREYNKEVLARAKEQLRRIRKIQADKKKMERKKLAEIAKLERKLKTRK